MNTILPCLGVPEVCSIPQASWKRNQTAQRSLLQKWKHWRTGIMCPSPAETEIKLGSVSYMYDECIVINLQKFVYVYHSVSFFLQSTSGILMVHWVWLHIDGTFLQNCKYIFYTNFFDNTYNNQFASVIVDIGSPIYITDTVKHIPLETLLHQTLGSPRLQACSGELSRYVHSSYSGQIITLVELFCISSTTINLISLESAIQNVCFKLCPVLY